MSFFSRLTSTVTSAISEAVAKVQEVTQEFSLDSLQEEYGDPTGVKQMYEGLDLTYLSPRMIAMGFPSSPSSKIRSRNDISAISSLLSTLHSGHFLIWSAAEEQVDASAFEDQVIEVNFPGYPAPPLGLLFKICTSIENWLAADPQNVAVIFCMTGKGRTSVISACALAWLGEFDNPISALDYVVERRVATWRRYSTDVPAGVEAHCTPSQIRYVQYFAHVLDGVKPRSGACVLRRVIMNGVPDMVKHQDGGESGEGSGATGIDRITNAADATLGDALTAVSGAAMKAATTAKELLRGDFTGEGVAAIADETPTPQAAHAPRAVTAPTSGCRPYLQLFRGSKLLFSSTWTRDARKDDTIIQDEEASPDADLKWYTPEDGSVRFGDIDIPVGGDILMRCRHYGDHGERETLWRAAFHTGYVQDHVLRLSKNHLDVAVHDDRISSDFWVEFVFAPVVMPSGDGSSESTAAAPSGREPEGLEGSVTVTAADVGDYEAALAAESSLWMDINARKLAHGGGGSANGHPKSGTGPSMEEIIKKLVKRGIKPSKVAEARHDDGTSQERHARTRVHEDAVPHANKPAGITAPGPARAAVAATAPPTATTVALDKDIAELEELERELGISESGDGKTPVSGDHPPSAATQAAVASSHSAPPAAAGNDEIEDLEKYLNSLA